MKKTTKKITKKATKKATKKSTPTGKPYLRASGAGIWTRCPASANMGTAENIFLDQTAAEFGTAVHALAAMQYDGELGFPAECLHFTKDEMLLAEEYCAFYLEALRNLPGKEQFSFIERKLEWEGTDVIIGGTADAVFVREVDGELILYCVDLKTGRTPVEARNNAQVKTYLHLAYNALPLEFKKSVSKTFVGMIVQPSQNEIRYEKFQYNPFYFGNLERHFVAVRKEQEFLFGGHCKYCEAAATRSCKEFNTNFEKFLSPEFFDETSIRPEELAKLLPMTGAVKTVCERVEATAKGLLKSGVKIPGFTLRSKKGRRVFVATATPEKIARELKIKKSDAVKISLHTPAELEKKAGKSQKLNDLVFTPYSEFIAPEVDPFDNMDSFE